MQTGLWVCPRTVPQVKHLASAAEEVQGYIKTITNQVARVLIEC